MPDPLHPTSFPSLKPEKPETLAGVPGSVNVTYKNQNRDPSFVFARIILKDKYSSMKDKKEVIKPQVSSLKPQTLYLDSSQTISSPNMSNQTNLNFEKPTFVTKISCWFRSLSPGSFISSFKMSDKQPGRPMKYPYTFTAKIAQFPFKYYINNNWMWKYYFIAVAVSFPVFYKLSRMSNSPENVKVWEDIRKRDFAPGPHHH